ncbi:MAG: hypothetical protein K1W10_00175 [Lachnospiraceae bacterium]
MILLKILLYFLVGEGVEDMAIVYALLIVKGKKDYSDVPAKLKEQVRDVLIDMEVADLAAE